MLLYSGILYITIYITCVLQIAQGFCSGQVFLQYTLHLYEPWVLVNVTVERWVAVSRPLKAKMWFTGRRVGISLALTALASVAMHVHKLWHMKLADINHPGTTIDGTSTMVPYEGNISTQSNLHMGISTQTPSRIIEDTTSIFDTTLLDDGRDGGFQPPRCGFTLSKNGLNNVHIIDMVFATVLPFSLMLVMNVAIGVRLYHSQKFRALGLKRKGADTRRRMKGRVKKKADMKMKAEDETSRDPKGTASKEANLTPSDDSEQQPTNSSSSPVSKETRSTTITLLSVTTVFLVLKAPRSAFLVYHTFFDMGTMTIYDKAMSQLVWTVTDLLVALNSAINILLYCATGHRFRRQLVKMIGCQESDTTPGSGTVTTSSGNQTQSRL